MTLRSIVGNEGTIRSTIVALDMIALGYGWLWTGWGGGGMNGWMVTRGDYSDYRVLAVFTSQDAACAYAARRAVVSELGFWSNDTVRVEPIEIDPVADSEAGYHAVVEVRMDIKTGNIVWMRFDRRIHGHTVGETYRPWLGSDLYTIIEYQPHADYAKIAGERRAQWLARQEGWRDE